MTIQVRDSLHYLGEQHVLISCSAGEPFSPVDAGYRPFMKSTGCWRGYIARYQVVDGLLQLHDLSLNHRPRAAPGPRRPQPPSLNGMQAVREDEFFLCDWSFSDVKLPLYYTGGMVIARSFVNELSRHRVFHPAWGYQLVQELVFKQGLLVETNDASVELHRLRNELNDQSKLDSVATFDLIDATMVGCFSQNYVR